MSLKHASIPPSTSRQPSLTSQSLVFSSPTTHPTLDMLRMDTHVDDDDSVTESVSTYTLTFSTNSSFTLGRRITTHQCQAAVCFLWHCRFNFANDKDSIKIWASASSSQPITAVVSITKGGSTSFCILTARVTYKVSFSCGSFDKPFTNA
jgi:hypothetical protein